MIKNKFLTFSFDDGVIQDVRLIKLLDKYGMKATFNLNSGLLGEKRVIEGNGIRIDHIKNQPKDVKDIYQGHEIAAHTITHVLLPAITDEEELIHQVEEDRMRLSELCGYEVVGMAYPCGGKNYSNRVSEVIKKKTGIRYARTIESSHSFEFSDDLYQLKPSVYSYREMDMMFNLGKAFLELKTEEPKMFYVWGHAYEFDIRNDWKRFEEFLEMMSGRNDICYCTNKKVLLENDSYMGYTAGDTITQI